MKNFMKEFKEFINRGSVMDMAIGIIIGAAFTAIVTSLVDNIVQPLIILLTGGHGTEVSGLVIPVAGSETGIDFGAFISACINFILIALVVFCLIKAITKMQNLGSTVKTKVVKKDGEEMIETAPVCPYCLEGVNEGATRCSHCAAELPEPAKPTFEPAA